MKEKLEELLNLPLDRGKLLIFTHDNPDPDSIASAAAMAHLLKERRGVDATVAYSGIIGRAENRAMLEQLDLSVTHLDDLDTAEFAHLALVDAQPGTGNSATTKEHVIDIVVDHHPLREQTRNARFFDVREEIGASATMLTGYLRDAEVEIPTDLATGLLYGIRSETQDLGREVSPEDRDAYEFLIPKMEPLKMAAIARPALERRYYQQLAVALDALMVGDEVVICSLGEVTDPDFVPEMADLVVRMEGIMWSFAYGSYSNKLYVSIRANDPLANAGDVMHEVLEGVGRGGGHGMRAGGNVDLTEIKMTRGELESDLKHRFLAATENASATLVPLKTARFEDEDSDDESE
ncbi:MAG: DHH family phosphoesterase [Thermoanaerobaculia bacterium]|nr:DHH family phosphoesterase [Thermoanaerobaculia bacterium]